MPLDISPAYSALTCYPLSRHYWHVARPLPKVGKAHVQQTGGRYPSSSKRHSYTGRPDVAAPAFCKLSALFSHHMAIECVITCWQKPVCSSDTPAPCCTHQKQKSAVQLLSSLLMFAMWYRHNSAADRGFASKYLHASPMVMSSLWSRHLLLV